MRRSHAALMGQFEKRAGKLSPAVLEGRERRAVRVELEGVSRWEKA